MKDGYQICLEVAREADAKYPHDLDRAMEFARVKAKRELGMGPDTNPWVVDQIMPTIRHALHMARANANRNLAREREQLPAKAPESCNLSSLPPERPKNLRPAIAAADAQAEMLGKAMAKLAKQLPVADWVERQRGFGIGNFARIIGETGDLSLYANPAKVWKRLGLAPFKGQAPSTWKRKGGLSAEEWTALGYCPRRRAVCYVVSECLLKGNGSDGRYRQRYDQAKERFAAAHPDEKPIHCHKHAMLLMVKMLVRDLWVVWNKGEADLDSARRVA